MKAAEIHLIGAARPNFMKIAPLWRCLSAKDWCRVVLVHTGQHYDRNMSGNFFDDLGMPAPDINLGIGSGSHAEQTGRVMMAYEAVCEERRPAWTIVVGDVNSTAACTMTAAKLGIRVAHLEAGLRSRDRTMPEEINRLVTDVLADLLWTPSRDADENLLAEGVAPEKIDFVGNIMIDSFEMMRDRIEASQSRKQFPVTAGEYAVLTLHRPSNVDDPQTLARLVDAIAGIGARLPVIFPVHPRTRQRLADSGLMARLEGAAGVYLCAPVGYIEFMSLVTGARLVATDSGGIQEETTYLGIPCLTLRENTERPVTVSLGTNRLIGVGELAAQVAAILDGGGKSGSCPELWDGHTAGRIAESLKGRLGR